MDIKLNDEVIFTISETDIAYLKYIFPAGTMASEIRVRLSRGFRREVEQAKAAIKAENIDALIAKNDFIPTNEESLLALIMSDPEYKNQDDREAERRLQHEAEEAARALAEAAAEEQQRELDRKLAQVLEDQRRHEEEEAQRREKERLRAEEEEAERQRQLAQEAEDRRLAEEEEERRRAEEEANAIDPGEKDVV